MSLSRHQIRSLRLAIAHGAVVGTLFGVGGCALALWNGIAAQSPLSRVIVGLTGLTVLCAVACGTVRGLWWLVQSWLRDLSE